jgi:hypothetical protein
MALLLGAGRCGRGGSVIWDPKRKRAWWDAKKSESTVDTPKQPTQQHKKRKKGNLDYDQPWESWQRKRQAARHERQGTQLKVGRVAEGDQVEAQQAMS